MTRSYVIGPTAFQLAGESSFLDELDVVYGPFRVDHRKGSPVLLRIEHGEAGFELSNCAGRSESHPDEAAALRAAYSQLGQLVVSELASAGIYAIHAACLEYDGGAVIVAGPSGAGKTTLALGLLGRGLRLLSDEHALVPPTGSTIGPFLRSVQVRPNTHELIPELRFLSTRTPRDLGSGPKWSLEPGELARLFPGCIGASAPLRSVVTLDPVHGTGAASIEPSTAGITTVELARGTPHAAVSLTPVLTRLGELVTGRRCARLHSGSLPSTIDCLLDWLAAGDA
ncbi:MAG TPA: hypothetical protein VH063_19225 [Gaiellaceae bacterium]|nr:hypothetical protein [Gaiellaceae bacterium]